MRTASILHFLAAHFRVHLVCFTAGEAVAGGDPWPADTVDDRDWVSLPVHRKSWAARALRNSARWLRGVAPLSDRFCGSGSREQVARAISGRQYELAVVEHFWCASYLEMLRRAARRVVLDMHNIESALHAQCARLDGWPARWVHGRFAGISIQAERKWLPQFDLVLAASEIDRLRLLDLAPGARVAVYPNAIPLRFPAEGEEEHSIAFSGNLEYHPNVAAVRWFAREIWPELRRRDPLLRWLLIGKNDKAVRGCLAGDPRIETTGAIENSPQALARASVVVVPLLTGSGTRIKILEAWAAGRAVVSTRIGAEGLPALDGENLLLADSPPQFVEAVLALLANVDLRRRLGRAGRAVVEQQLCWPVVWRGLEENLRTLLPAFLAARNAIPN